MVNRSEPLDAVFGALSDATRRDMLVRLSQDAATVGELGAPYDMTKGAISKHVKVLERAGLLRRDVRGRVHHCELDPEPLGVAQRWVESVREFWSERLDDLADYLEELQKPPHSHEGPKR